MDWIETLNAVIDSGGLELILGAVGLPVAAAGVGGIGVSQKGSKSTRFIHLDDRETPTIWSY